MCCFFFFLFLRAGWAKNLCNCWVICISSGEICLLASEQRNSSILLLPAAAASFVLRKKTNGKSSDEPKPAWKMVKEMRGAELAVSSLGTWQGRSGLLRSTGEETGSCLHQHVWVSSCTGCMENRAWRSSVQYCRAVLLLAAADTSMLL